MIRKASLVVALRLIKDEVVVQVAVEEISVVLNPDQKNAREIGKGARGIVIGTEIAREIARGIERGIATVRENERERGRGIGRGRETERGREKGKGRRHEKQKEK